MAKSVGLLKQLYYRDQSYFNLSNVQIDFLNDKPRCHIHKLKAGYLKNISQTNYKV